MKNGKPKEHQQNLPEDESAKNLEGDRVGLEISRGLQRVSILIVETSTARSKDDGGNQSCYSSSHVDNTRSCEINDTNVTESITAEGSEESIATPDGVDNHWINKSGEEKRVAQVSGHLASLGNSSSNNGGSCGGKGELEEPSMVGGKVNKEKVGVSNEGLVRVVITTVSKGETDSEETNGTTTGIQQVLQHNVLDVLLTDRSGTKHGETGLHEENESSLRFEDLINVNNKETRKIK